LKIPKVQSKSVHRRRTDNTMVKRKSTKGQKSTNIQHNGQKKKYKRTNNDLQTKTQWPKEKGQKDKQRSTKHTMAKQKDKGQSESTKHKCKTKDRVTRTPLKTGGELRKLKSNTNPTKNRG